MQHVPVLLAEVLEGLNLSPGAHIIDATLGLGGHTKAMLDITAPNGTVVGIERDARNLEDAKQVLNAYGDRVRYIQDSFGNLARHELEPVDAILFDLGISSAHVDDISRGFSFRGEAPLDMRFDVSQELTAEIVVNSFSKDELEEMLRKLGEEPRARDIAKAIFEARKKERIKTTTQLATLVESVVRRYGKAHPATRTFQAIRMVVNDELGEIERALPAAVDRLRSGGRIAVITFHSLEDRLVKSFLKTREDLTVITKKPIKPSRTETWQNPRARSAKLRIAQKV